MKKAVSLLGLAMGLAGLIWVAQLGAAEKKDDGTILDPKTGKRIKRPPIPPFKYSAWCAFRNYRNFITTQKLRKPKAYENDKSRPGAGSWGGYSRKGHWVTLVVEVQNTTKPKDKIIYKGSLNIALHPSEKTTEGIIPYKTRYKQSFEVPPATKRKYYFSVLCPEFYSNRIDIAFNTNRGQFSRSVSLRSLEDKSEDLIVVVSDKAGAFRYLIPMKKNNDPVLTEERSRAVSVVRPDELPRQWHDLTIANLIIIDGPPRTPLDDRQIDALEGYLQNGGRILISSNKDPSRFKTPDGQTRSLGELAGITVTQMGTIKSLDQIDPSYQPEAGEEFELSVIDIRPDRSRGPITVSRNNNRIIERIDRDIGMGSISILSFSLSDQRLATWAGRSQIPLELLTLGRRRPLFKFQPLQTPDPNYGWGFGWGMEAPKPYAPNNTLPGLRKNMDISFAEDTPVAVQTKQTVASFLLLYLLAVVPVNYFIFGWFKRREIAWLAVPIWAVMFSVFAYFWGYAGQLGKQTINEVSVVEAGVSESTAIARTFMGIYSPLGGHYRLDLKKIKEKSTFNYMAAPGHLISPDIGKIRGLGEQPPLNVIENNDQLRVEGLKIDARSTRRLEFIHRTDLGEGINLTLKKNIETGEHTIEIKNNTPFQLLNAAVLLQGATSEMKGVPLKNIAIASGAQASQTVGQNEWTTKEEAFLNRNVSFRSSMGKTSGRKNALIQYVGERFQFYQKDLFLAWIDGGMLPVQINGEPPRVNRGLTLLLIPFQAEKATRRKINIDVKWPVASAHDIDIITDVKWRALIYKKGRARFSLRGNNEALMFLKITMPNQVRRVRNKKIQLQFGFGGLRGGTAGIPQQAPTHYKGTFSVAVKQYTGTPARWKDQPQELGAFNLKAGKKIPITLNLEIDSSMLDENNAVLVKISIPDLKIKGTQDVSAMEWPLVVEDLKPLKFSGKDLSR